MSQRINGFGGLLMILALAPACGRMPEKDAPRQVAPPPVETSAFDYHVEWISNDAPATMTAGSTATVGVRIRNAGRSSWPDPREANPSQPTGEKAVRLAYRWWGPSDSVPAVDYGIRADLPSPLAPGREQTLRMEVTAPDEPGEYLLQFDLVQEMVVWFETQGAPKLLIPVAVEEQ